MYCSNCGAVVVGKFCSCCGKRVLGTLEAFRKQERKRLNDFKKQSGSDFQLAEACWYACQRKYGARLIKAEPGVFVPEPDAYEKLDLMEAKAKALFLRLLSLDDF